VWQKVTAGLTGISAACPSEKALRTCAGGWDRRRSKRCSKVVARLLAQTHTPGVRSRGLHTVAFDGCNSIMARDTDRNLSWYQVRDGLWRLPDPTACSRTLKILADGQLSPGWRTPEILVSGQVISRLGNLKWISPVWLATGC
jgi:hypothetical protein